MALSAFSMMLMVTKPNPQLWPDFVGEVSYIDLGLLRWLHRRRVVHL
jgi:hypothetical protein